MLTNKVSYIFKTPHFTISFFFFNETPTTELYTLSLHDALPISVDADTGQVGPELAELLDLPFATGARYLSLQKHMLHLRCEHDDGWVQAEVPLPAVVSTAERLIEPCKVDPPGRAAVPAARVHRLTASDLGNGPWGEDGSPTSVGRVRVQEVTRARAVLSGPVDEQVRDAVRLLTDRGALDASADEPALEPVPTTG